MPLSNACAAVCAAFCLCLTARVAFAQMSSDNKKIVLKVNFGGGPVGDFLGEDQVLDMSDFSKNVARVKIENTDQPEIFQSTRFARGRDMTFRIPVPTGFYSVTLLFAETFRPACVPGARVFDISMGTPVSGVSKIVESFDVFQSAGCFSAHGKRFDKVPSKDGIVVHLTQKAQHPALCGLIVEGFPMPVGDGSEYKAIGREEGGGQSGFMQPIIAGRRRSAARRLATVHTDLPADADVDAESDKLSQTLGTKEPIVPHALHQPANMSVAH